MASLLNSMRQATLSRSRASKGPQSSTAQVNLIPVCAAIQVEAVVSSEKTVVSAVVMEGNVAPNPKWSIRNRSYS